MGFVSFPERAIHSSTRAKTLTGQSKINLDVRTSGCGDPLWAFCRSSSGDDASENRYIESGASLPVLSPILSTGTPRLSNILKYRFAIGVPFGYLM